MTSQIFANIYLNEFDRFVRQQIKPLGYVRYGDDFVAFLPSQAAAYTVQAKSADWLLDNLKLKIHAKNNVVVKAGHGLQFLGHNIYPSSPIAVNKFMVKKIKQGINSKNIASYKAVALPRKKLKQLPWLLLQDQNK